MNYETVYGRASQSCEDNILKVIEIVNDLEDTFEGRHCTMDGHLIGSMGEVMAAYYYGIELYDAFMHVHDGIAPCEKEVQIQMTQIGIDFGQVGTLNSSFLS